MSISYKRTYEGEEKLSITVSNDNGETTLDQKLILTKTQFSDDWSGAIELDYTYGDSPTEVATKLADNLKRMAESILELGNIDSIDLLKNEE